MTYRSFTIHLSTCLFALANLSAQAQTPLSISPTSSATAGEDLYGRWLKLDRTIQGWWDNDMRQADEKAILESGDKTLLFLPHPYSSAGGSEDAFAEMYGWDTQFINLALLAHGRTRTVRQHILNHLFMIDRFGMVLNGNRTYYQERSQPPLLAWSVKNYLAAVDDNDLALRAYAGLEREYTDFWCKPPHQTPTGLATCNDLKSPDYRAELTSECEAGLDFTPIFGGDVRRCVPIHINAALVVYAEVLGSLADRMGWAKQAAEWQRQARERSRLINEFCWDEKQGFYFEYDYVSRKQVPCYSLNAYWLLWAGVASKEQAARVVEQLKRFEQPAGLSFTDRDYPSPHPEWKVLEWAYPEAWPPLQIIVAQGLERYGFQDKAQEVGHRYLTNVVRTWEQTGQLWERYNAVSGGHDVPIERTPSAPLHGWSSAAAVVLGRMSFPSEPRRTRKDAKKLRPQADLPR